MATLRRRPSNPFRDRPDETASETSIELDQLSIGSHPPPYDSVVPDNTSASSSRTRTKTTPTTTSGNTTGNTSTIATFTSFVPTLRLRVDARGKSFVGLPINTAPHPIAIFEEGHDDNAPLYVSLRASRRSSSSWLVRGDDPAATPVCNTVYRMGPRHPPRVCFSAALSAALPAAPLDSTLRRSSPAQVSAQESAQDSAQQSALEFTVDRRGAFTRATRFRTRLGNFGWRYASRTERRAFKSVQPPDGEDNSSSSSDGAGDDVADSLLVLERITTVALAGGTTGEAWLPVACLARGNSTRTRGTGRCTAGNGGLLVMDLRRWQGSEVVDKNVDNKTKRAATAVVGRDEEEMRVVVVATCLVMLKKEVDRRRVQQALMIGAIGGGGGP